MSEEKEGLLERVGDRRRLVDEHPELLFDLEGVFGWAVARMGDGDRHAPQPTRHGGIGKEAVGEQGVDVEDVPPANLDLGKVVDDMQAA